MYHQIVTEKILNCGETVRKLNLTRTQSQDIVDSKKTYNQIMQQKNKKGEFSDGLGGRSGSTDLLRSIAMLMIISCHLVSHSGIEINNFSLNSSICTMLSIGGVLGDNLFVLISGYHSINTRFSIQKVGKLVL